MHPAANSPNTVSACYLQSESSGIQSVLPRHRSRKRRCRQQNGRHIVSAQVQCATEWQMLPPASTAPRNGETLLRDETHSVCAMKDTAYPQRNELRVRGTEQAPSRVQRATERRKLPARWDTLRVRDERHFVSTERNKRPPASTAPRNGENSLRDETRFACASTALRNGEPPLRGETHSVCAMRDTSCPRNGTSALPRPLHHGTEKTSGAVKHTPCVR